jgi:hypothetical protein
MEKIDFVVTWVDSSDPEWIKSYNHYRPEKPIEDSARFRDWDIFRYWFRAVERYAPWVNKVFLVTNGKYPDWINPDCEKLVLVNHSDYIPEKYLPTFNSNTIELNFGRIKELSEHFVLFNDDMILNAPIGPDYYFRDGLPCDYNFESPYSNRLYTKENKYGIGVTNYCNVAVLNSHFNRKNVVRQAWRKWYGRHLWGKPLLLSLLMLGREQFENFNLFHIEQPMLKSVFQEIWEKEPDLLDRSCSQFRLDTNLNQYFIRYWQFALNKFYPSKRKGLYYHIYNKDILTDLQKVLLEERTNSVCINDTPYCHEKDFPTVSKTIRECFEKKFPNKSIYEKHNNL